MILGFVEHDHSKVNPHSLEMLTLARRLAGETAVRLLTERTGGEGGLIAIDYLGQIGIAFNTTAMPYAQAAGEGEVVVGR